MKYLPAGSVLVLLGMAAVSCATTQYTPTSFYTLAPRAEIHTEDTSPLSLGIRPLDYAQFYKQPMVYRGDDYSIAHDVFNSWAELPRDTITRALIDILDSAGYFSDVGYAHDMVRPDLLLTGELRQLDELRSAPSSSARVEARFELRSRNTGEVHWSDTLAFERPMAGAGPAALAAAMSDAVSELIEEAARKIVAHAPKDS